jgi:hypothetical protein
VQLEDLPPCQNIISLDLAIKAILDVSLRMRLIMSFTDCTYIPFLIRWDLVPPWENSSQDNSSPIIANKDSTNNAIEEDCIDEEKKPEVISPFIEALKQIDPNADDTIKEVQIKPIELPVAKILRRKRGAPVKKTEITRVSLDKKANDLRYSTETEVINVRNFSQKVTSVKSVSYNIKPDTKFPFDIDRITINRH